MIPFNSLKSKIRSSYEIMLFQPIKSNLTNHAMLEFANSLVLFLGVKILSNGVTNSLFGFFQSPEILISVIFGKGSAKLMMLLTIGILRFPMSLSLEVT